jgi:hypothetical protein
MPDPINRLALTLAPYVFGTAQGNRLPGRLRPLLVGRPHPRRRLGRWGTQAAISAALARSKAAAAPEELAHG